MISLIYKTNTGARCYVIVDSKYCTILLKYSINQCAPVLYTFQWHAPVCESYIPIIKPYTHIIYIYD